MTAIPLLGLDDDTDIDLLGSHARFAWFFITSNAAFDLFAEANNLTASGDFTGLDYTNITYNLRHFTPASPSIGQRSQNPAVGGSGVVIGQGGQGSTLNDLAAGPVKVFDGGRKTGARERHHRAASRGLCLDLPPKRRAD